MTHRGIFGVSRVKDKGKLIGDTDSLISPAESGVSGVVGAKCVVMFQTCASPFHTFSHCSHAALSHPQPGNYQGAHVRAHPASLDLSARVVTLGWRFGTDANLFSKSVEGRRLNGVEHGRTRA